MRRRGRIRRHDGWPGIPPLEHTLTGIEPQVPLDIFRLGRVATVPLAAQDGADFGFEEFDLGPVVGTNVTFFGEQLGCLVRIV